MRALGQVPPTTTVFDSIHGSGWYQEIIGDCYSGDMYKYMYRHGLKVDDAAIAATVVKCVHGRVLRVLCIQSIEISAKPCHYAFVHCRA